jgi:hypothetical protein
VVWVGESWRAEREIGVLAAAAQTPRRESEPNQHQWGDFSRIVAAEVSPLLVSVFGQGLHHDDAMTIRNLRPTVSPATRRYLCEPPQR